MRPWGRHHGALTGDHVHAHNRCIDWQLGIPHDNCPRRASTWIWIPDMPTRSSGGMCKVCNVVHEKKDRSTIQSEWPKPTVVFKSINNVLRCSIKLGQDDITPLHVFKIALRVDISSVGCFNANTITYDTCCHHQLPLLLAYFNVLFTEKCRSMPPDYLDNLLIAIPMDAICDHCVTRFILQNGDAFFTFLSQDPIRTVSFAGLEPPVRVYTKLRFICLLQGLCRLIIKNKVIYKHVLRNRVFFVSFYRFIMDSTHYLLKERHVPIAGYTGDISLHVLAGKYHFVLTGAHCVYKMLSRAFVDVFWCDMMRWSMCMMRSYHIRLLITRVSVHRVMLKHVLARYLLIEPALDPCSDLYTAMFARVSETICFELLQTRRQQTKLKRDLKWKRFENEIGRALRQLKRSRDWASNTYSEKTAEIWDIASDLSKYFLINGRNDTFFNARTGSACCNPKCCKLQNDEIDGHESCLPAFEPKLGFKTCSTCKSVWYCSRHCQKMHWNHYGHKVQCRRLRRQNS